MTVALFHFGHLEKTSQLGGGFARDVECLFEESAKRRVVRLSPGACRARRGRRCRPCSMQVLPGTVYRKELIGLL